MSFGTGPPAPPPLRKSRWSWWKPVKGTSAYDDYYYNANNNSNNNSRPGSSSSSIRPGSSSSNTSNKLSRLLSIRRGRNSLSVLDDKRAEALRKEVSSYMKDGPTAMTSSSTNVDAIQVPIPRNSSNDKLDSSKPSGSGGPKNNRKSTSR